MIGDDLLKNNFKDKKFVTFDFETNGLSLKYSLPWELYFQINHGEQLIKTHHLLIKWPNYKISDQVAMLTHYNREKVESFGIEPPEAVDLFDSYLYNSEYSYVGSNIFGYDSMIHNILRNQCGKDTDYSWLDRTYDTHLLSKAYKLLLTKPKDESIVDWQFKLYSIVKKGLKTGVKSMCTEFEIPFQEERLHDAAYDSFLTFSVFKNLVNRMDI